MKKVLVYTNLEKDPKEEYAKKIRGILKEEKLECVFSRHKEERPAEDGVDLVISIGGDGTMISAIRGFKDQNPLFIGLNVGKLGFLTEMTPQTLKADLKKILSNRYEVEERNALLASIGKTSKKQYFAINDVVVGRGQMARLIGVEIYINLIYVDTYFLDGMIVATSTGSTAYNLSAGGPILKADGGNIVLTPICPHSLRARPLVISEGDTVTMKLISDVKDMKEVPNLNLDGQEIHSLKNDDIITVKASNQKIRILSLRKEHFFKKLRDKIR